MKPSISSDRSERSSPDIAGSPTLHPEFDDRWESCHIDVDMSGPAYSDATREALLALQSPSSPIQFSRSPTTTDPGLRRSNGTANPSQPVSPVLQVHSAPPTARHAVDGLLVESPSSPRKRATSFAADIDDVADSAKKLAELSISPSTRALSTLMEKVTADLTLSRVERAEAAAVLAENSGHVGKALNRLRVVHNSAAAEATAAAETADAAAVEHSDSQAPGYYSSEEYFKQYDKLQGIERKPSWCASVCASITNGCRDAGDAIESARESLGSPNPTRQSTADKAFDRLRKLQSKRMSSKYLADSPKISVFESYEYVAAHPNPNPNLSLFPTLALTQDLCLRSVRVCGQHSVQRPAPTAVPRASAGATSWQIAADCC